MAQRRHAACSLLELRIAALVHFSKMRGELFFDFNGADRRGGRALYFESEPSSDELAIIPSRRRGGTQAYKERDPQIVEDRLSREG
jgi:hypothetical protein